MALQRLGDRKIKQLRKRLDLDILAAHTEHNHRLTLYTRDKRVFHLYRGRLTECKDCSIGVTFTPELLAHWEVLNEE
jgi:hypothetical protein